MEPRRGAIARCSLGRVGIIECDGVRPVYYEDGNFGLAWTGRHIWPPEWFGKPWSSRNPTVIGYAKEE